MLDLVEFGGTAAEIVGDRGDGPIRQAQGRQGDEGGDGVGGAAGALDDGGGEVHHSGTEAQSQAECIPEMGC